MDNTYWNSNGKYQMAADLLHLRVPTEGEVVEPRKNKALEKYRRATNCYYDLYNNGLINRSAEFTRVFGIHASRYKYGWDRMRFHSSLYEKLEPVMDRIICDAAIEQGLGLSIVDTL